MKSAEQNKHGLDVDQALDGAFGIEDYTLVQVLNHGLPYYVRTLLCMM